AGRAEAAPGVVVRPRDPGPGAGASRPRARGRLPSVVDVPPVAAVLAGERFARVPAAAHEIRPGGRRAGAAARPAPALHGGEVLYRHGAARHGRHAAI